MERTVEDLLEAVKSTSTSDRETLERKFALILAKHDRQMVQKASGALQAEVLHSDDWDRRQLELTQQEVFGGVLAELDAVRKARKKVYEWLRMQSEDCGEHPKPEEFILPSWTPVGTRTHFATKLLETLGRKVRPQDRHLYQLTILPALSNSPDCYSFPSDCVLSDVALAAECVAREGRCPIGEATNFVLTGDTPKQPSVKIRIDPATGQAPGRIHLVLDPFLTSSEVAKIYRSVLKLAMGREKAKRPTSVSLSRARLYHLERSTLEAKYLMGKLSYFPIRSAGQIMVLGKDVSRVRTGFLNFRLDNSKLAEVQAKRMARIQVAADFVSHLERACGAFFARIGESYEEATKLNLHNICGTTIWKYVFDDGLAVRWWFGEGTRPVELFLPSIQLIAIASDEDTALQAAQFVSSKSTTILDSIADGFAEDDTPIASLVSHVRARWA